jgi:hypothetical protein
MRITLGFLTSLIFFATGSISSAQTQDIDQFRQYESYSVQWNQRYLSAPAGSWDESNARSERDRSIQYALSSISQPYAFYGLNRVQVEYFADEMTQKYQQASSGSALETMYRSAQGYAFQAFRSAVLDEVQQLSYDWRRLHDLAKYFDQKYQQAPSGSQKEAAYNDGRRQAWNSLPSAVTYESQRYTDFRQFEQLANYFDGLYIQAPTGSTSESIYRQISRDHYNRGVQAAQNQFRYYGPNELYSIQERYNQLYQQASTGSVKENYYRQIRDLARQMIEQYRN